MYKTICIGPEQMSVWLSYRRYQLVVANSTADMLVIVLYNNLGYILIHTSMLLIKLDISYLYWTYSYSKATG